MTARTLVEVCVVVRTLPYSDGHLDVEARGLDTHNLYQFKQDRYRVHLFPGDHLAVYRPPTKGTVVYLEKLIADYNFEKIEADSFTLTQAFIESLDLPPEGAG